jgi:mannosyltransferase
MSEQLQISRFYSDSLWKQIMHVQNKYSMVRISLLFIILLGFGLRVYQLEAQSLWWDEIFTAARSAMTVGELIEDLFTARVHLPFYFILLQGWTEIGRSAFILRYFSVAAGVLTIPLIYVTGKRLNGRSVGLLAAFLLAIAPFHIWFSQEARMYSFLALNALAANFFLLRLLHQESRWDWVAYAVALTFTLYTHYLAVLILIAHYVFFSLHYRRDPARFKRWFISAGIAGMLFLTWFLAVFLISSFRYAAIGWIAPVNWYEPLVTLFSFSIGPSIDPANFLPYMAFSVYLIGLLAVCWFVGRGQTVATSKLLSLRLLWCWLGVPLLLLALISMDWSIPDQRFIYMDRYITSLLPAFILLAAWGLILLSRQGWSPRWLMPLLLILIFLPTLFSWQNLYFNPDYARDDWRAAFIQIETASQDNDLLLLTLSQIRAYSYYGVDRVRYANLPDLLTCEEDERSPAFSSHQQCIGEKLQTKVETLPADVERVWLISAYHNDNTHGFPQARNVAAALAHPNVYEHWFDQEYTVVNQWQFTGIRLTLYDLTGDR